MRHAYVDHSGVDTWRRILVFLAFVAFVVFVTQTGLVIWDNPARGDDKVKPRSATEEFQFTPLIRLVPTPPDNKDAQIAALQQRIASLQSQLAAVTADRDAKATSLATATRLITPPSPGYVPQSTTERINVPGWGVFMATVRADGGRDIIYNGTRQTVYPVTSQPLVYPQYPVWPYWPY